MLFYFLFFSTVSVSGEKSDKKISELRHERKLLEAAEYDPTVKLCVNASFDTLAVYLGMESTLSTSFKISSVTASLISKAVSPLLVFGTKSH